MSSVYGVVSDPYYHPNPGDAVDGITTGENMFHTDIEYGAWWEVDLGEALVNVKQVVIFNRQDCATCQSRLSNAVVSLIDDRGVTFDYKDLGDTTGVSKLNLNFGLRKKSILPSKELEPVSDGVLHLCSCFVISSFNPCFSLSTSRRDTLNYLGMDGAEIQLDECTTT
jgi:hypothetical protein